MEETFTRKVMGPNGPMLKTFKRKKVVPSKSQVKDTTKKVEPKSEVNTKDSTASEISVEVMNRAVENMPAHTPEVTPTAVITLELVRAMEPQELRVLAEQSKLKLGNVKAKVKMQDKVIKLLGLEEDTAGL